MLLGYVGPVTVMAAPVVSGILYVVCMIVLNSHGD